MIGNNVLEINEATMIAAVQMYLDSMMVIKGAVIVAGVSRANGIGQMFNIQLEQRKEPPCTPTP
jgi:hypothetical protein